jgi:ABC-2 type transport system permease protein
MASTTDDTNGLAGRREPLELREVTSRPSIFSRVASIWTFRELLMNLTRKELKVKYKNSILGFAWSLLNPVLYLVVFGVVFQKVLQVKVPYYSIFFLSGLLAWNFFASSLSATTTSIVANASLVQKVRFPREILPLSAIGANIVHFVLQLFVLLGAMALFRRTPSWQHLPPLALAVVALLLLITALSLFLAAVNVYLRDTQHLLELVLLAWFWLSAVVYPYALVAKQLGSREWLALLNPMIPIITTFQRALYNPKDPNVVPLRDPSWYLRNVAVVSLGSFLLLRGSVWVFGRLEDNFGESI